MDDQKKTPESLPNTSEDQKNVSEGFGNSSEGFRKASEEQQKSSETLLRGADEKTPDHTLTVRRVVEMLEQASVARTERSVINWLVKNKHGVARLDGYFDPEERKWWITPQSIRRVVEEEQKKAGIPFGRSSEDDQKSSESFPKYSEDNQKSSEGLRKPSEDYQKPPEIIQKNYSGETNDVYELHRKVRDLEINNRAKDYFIDQLQSERKSMFDQITEQSRMIGKLETEVRLLGGPNKQASPDNVIEVERHTVEEQNRQNENQRAQ